MLKIRLSQIGKPGQRSYRIRVMDSRRKRDSGRYLDDLGYWNKIRKEFKLDQEKYEMWLNKGAQPTDGLSQMREKDSGEYKLSFVREKIIQWLRNLSKNKIEISLPESNFKTSASKIQDLDWKIINFSALDLKNKLKEDNYQLIRKELSIFSAQEKELAEQIFKELKIKAILSRKDNDKRVAVLEDHSELPLLLSPFNFEFSFAGLDKTYSTRNNPIHIIEPELNKE